MENYASAMNGVCSPKDLETMFQLLYLNFTQPRFDENDYNTLMKMLRAQLENVKSNPDYLMEDKFIDVAYGNNPRRQMVSTEIIDKFSFEALPAIYKKLYPDANSFVFKFVGNVDLETLKPLVEKYIGSIPTSKKPMTFADDKCDPVKGEVTEDFTASMQQPKVSVRYMFSGEMPYTLKNKAALSFLTQALNSRYLVSIREEKGGTYGVQVSGSTEYIPSETYNMTISFDTNEEMADELREIVMKEIEEIAANGPKSEDIEKNREFMLKSWKNSLEQNAARDRNEGDRRDRRQRPQERRHREKPRVHAQELERQPRTECQLDELPQQQIRLRARLPGRLRRGAQDADRRRRTGHGQEGAFRR